MMTLPVTLLRNRTSGSGRQCQWQRISCEFFAGSLRSIFTRNNTREDIIWKLQPQTEQPVPKKVRGAVS